MVKSPNTDRFEGWLAFFVQRMLPVEYLINLKSGKYERHDADRVRYLLIFDRTCIVLVLLEVPNGGQQSSYKVADY